MQLQVCSCTLELQLKHFQYSLHQKSQLILYCNTQNITHSISSVLSHCVPSTSGGGLLEQATLSMLAVA